MKILHYKQTPIAWAPDELSKCINKYTNHHSEVFGYGRMRVPDALTYDLLVCHNRYLEFGKMPKTMMYHSEPTMVDLNPPVSNKSVIAQYHATLPEFSDCNVVRNIIDYNQPIYNPKPELSAIRIGYSPSRKDKMGKWHDKGYPQTIKILENILKKRDNVSVDVITGVTLEECLRRKNDCNIFIDECITGSYHRSGLEGLALGKLTLCYLSEPVEAVFKKHSHSTTLPYYNVNVSNLEFELDELIDAGLSHINEQGYNNRLWMERYWNPEVIVNEFIQYYNDIK